jgi:hypothetical protein
MAIFQSSRKKKEGRGTEIESDKEKDPLFDDSNVLPRFGVFLQQ